MHVGFNLVFMVPGQTGGMEVAARALIPAVRDAAPGARFTAFVNREAAGEDLGVETVVVPVEATSRVQWVRGEQQLLPGLARRAGCDIVHSLGSTAPARGRFVRVTTIHDLNYLMVPDAHFGVRGLGMRVLVPLAAHASHRVVADSESTRRDLMARLGTPAAKIDVVPLGLGRPATASPTPERGAARAARPRRPAARPLAVGEAPAQEPAGPARRPGAHPCRAAAGAGASRLPHAS